MRKVLAFLSEVRAELSKVVWPTRAKAARLTVIVVLVSIVSGAFLAAIDYGLGKGVEYAINSAQKGKKGATSQPAPGGGAGQPVQVPAGGAGAQAIPVPAGAAQPAPAQPANPIPGQ